jgi:hypothetical protein
MSSVVKDMVLSLVLVYSGNDISAVFIAQKVVNKSLAVWGWDEVAVSCNLPTT